MNVRLDIIIININVTVVRIVALLATIARRTVRVAKAIIIFMEILATQIQNIILLLAMIHIVLIAQLKIVISKTKIYELHFRCLNCEFGYALTYY